MQEQKKVVPAAEAATHAQDRELAGVVVPVVTPVDNDDRVDEVAFRKSLRRLIDSGVQGLFVGGSAGEGPLLTAHEWERMVTIARDEVPAAGRVNLLGGAIDTSTRRVLDKMHILDQLGFPFCVITPTYYTTLRTVDEHLRLFSKCAENAGMLKIVAYNIPSCTYSVVPVEILLELARRKLIQYLKESSGDFAYFSRLVTEGAEVGLKVLEGEEPHMAKGLLAGAKGIVPVCANFEPKTYLAAYEAGLKRDEAALAGLQARMDLVRDRLLFSGPLWIAGIKYGMSCIGYGSGKPVEPLEPPTAEQRKRIDAFVRESGQYQ